VDEALLLILCDVVDGVERDLVVELHECVSGKPHEMSVMGA
jgi:hypothetical protein